MKAAGSKDIAAAIRDKYPDLDNSGHGGASLWNLYACVEEGDLVILGDGATRRLVMEVKGPYEWVACPADGPGGDYQHQRAAVHTDLDPDEVWIKAGARFAKGQNPRWTLSMCGANREDGI
jgi:hypothetical protein